MSMVAIEPMRYLPFLIALDRQDLSYAQSGLVYDS